MRLLTKLFVLQIPRNASPGAERADRMELRKRNENIEGNNGYD
jgi:hypothetical protein